MADVLAQLVFSADSWASPRPADAWVAALRPVLPKQHEVSLVTSGFSELLPMKPAVCPDFGDFGGSAALTQAAPTGTWAAGQVWAELGGRGTALKVRRLPLLLLDGHCRPVL